MGRHSLPSESRGVLSIFGGRRAQRDDLFDRSFRPCTGCGADVYVLAEDCKDCGSAFELRAG
ncbi:hypothetical protein [Actinokineospora sp. NBRC 105648]|uniref:hypothetical protein n=1 Tax=Actinokineospora sp. NBRC 105648 TaxID=3032206 RepID=UPI0024A0842E|nr:hypothetical protein [Actinokineospora sp. NBRC 105648]GLZ43217.1 hypothetical protein Acsp05_68410 [Actinokineospora sp. NBRC 105648]